MPLTYRFLKKFHSTPISMNKQPFRAFFQCFELFYEKVSNKEGDKWVFGSMDLALKSARIVDLCGKSRGFVDFAENTVDRGSTVIFDADSGLCLS